MSYVPDYGLCEWVSNGQRCHYAGSVSDSTVGGGPWFCRHHHGLGDAAHGARIVAQSLRDLPRPDYSFEALRDASHRAARERVPAVYHGWTLADYRDNAKRMVVGVGSGSGRPWPEKALARVQAGEQIPYITRKWAAEWFRKQGRDDDAAAVEA